MASDFAGSGAFYDLEKFDAPRMNCWGGFDGCLVETGMSLAERGELGAATDV